MCDALALSALSTGIGFAQQQAQANAANAIQRQRAELNRRNVIAQYDADQRRYFVERADATRKKTEDALKALAAREQARTVGGARGVALSSRSLAQALAGISAAEGRAGQAQDDRLGDLSDEIRDRFDRAYRSGAASSLGNTTTPGPNPLATAVDGIDRESDVIFGRPKEDHGAFTNLARSVASLSNG